MQIQVINFQLKDLPVEEFQTLCDAIAPQWAAIPGLVSKVWIANEATNTYGGVYTWETREALDNYLQSDLFKAIMTNPNFTNATSSEFDVIEGPTRVTHGLAAVVAGSPSQ
ncbi:MAG TPA: YdhR family protein [Thermomicrobiales bacterium]|nr:YdhR family protein [Thermomicrobiales bacterium]